MSCGEGRRHGSDPTQELQLPVQAIQPLAWELPHAMGMALKGKKKKEILEGKNSEDNTELASLNVPSLVFLHLAD